MRSPLLAALLLVATAASASPAYDEALRQHRAGLHELALARVLREQPAQAGAPDWYEWESLRLTLLSVTQKPAELLARVQALPREAPPDLVRKAHGHAAWAHLGRNEGAAARHYLSQLVWRFNLPNDELELARRLVVQSYLVARQPDEAYRAMLRFHQDYAPIKPETADAFAKGLLDHDRVTEAMTWLPALEQGSATALRLAVRANLQPPDVVIKHARAALRQDPDRADYLLVLIDAANVLSDARLRLDALERLANLPVPRGATPAEPLALWPAYLSEAEAAGSRNRLLKGDDRAWLDFALGSEAAEPVVSRALYAYLTRHARQPQVRAMAQIRLFRALATQQLDLAAARMLGMSLEGKVLDVRALEDLLVRAGEDLPPPAARSLRIAAARYAEETNRPLLAADYYAQVVLSGDLREDDVLGNRALEQALRVLAQNGLEQDATQLRRYVSAARTAPRQQDSAAKKPKKK